MPNNNETTTKFKVDISELKSAMQEAKRQIQVTNSEFKAISSSMEDWESSTDGLSAKLKQLSSNLSSQKSILSSLEKQYELTVEQFGEGSAQADKLKIAINNQKTVINNTEKEIKKYNNELENLDEAEDEAEDGAKELSKEVEKAGKSAEKSGDGFTVFKGVLANLVTQGINLAVEGVKKLGSAMVDMVKESVGAYAEYEQLVGGVETLFKENADTVLKYANDAYKTAGMSANEYMSTVTSFSASLIASLGGDTAKASELSNKAIVMMSDNANKMGSDMESIQNAFNGFAKGQFNMLDNLKLGYGGNKTEMERLLADATALSGIDYDINSFADIIEAIHVIQTELDISGLSYEEAMAKVASGEMTLEEATEAMGTTAKEASTTISGSVDSMKSAWQNLIAGMADPTANFSQLVTNLVDSVQTVLSNLLPVITQALSGFGTLLTELSPIISEQLPSLIESVLPTLLSGITNLVSSVLSAIQTALPSVISTISEQLPTIIETTVDLLLSSVDVLANAGVQLFTGLVRAVTLIIPKLADKLPTIIKSIVNFFKDNSDTILDGAISLFMAIVEALPTIIESLAEALPELIENAVDTLMSNFDTILDGAIRLFMAIVEAIPTIIKTLIKELPRIIDTIINTLLSHLPELLDGAIKLLMAIIDALPTIITTLVQELPRIITTTVNTLLDHLPELIMGAVQLFMGLVEAIPLIIIELVKNLPQIITAIVSGLSEGIGSIVEIGKNLIRGLWNGIKDMGSWIKDKISGFGESVLGALKDFFGIHSPSKVMRDEIGKNIALGVAEGITQNKDYAEKSAEEMGALIVDSAKDKVKLLRDANKISLQDEIDYWREIRKNTKKGSDAYLEATAEIIKAKENANKALINNAKNEVKLLQDANKMSYAEEVTYWRNIRKQTKKGSEEYLEATAEIIKAKENANKALINDAKNEVKLLQDVNKMSYAEEIEYWREIRKQTKKGSDEYLEVTALILKAKENNRKAIDEDRKAFLQASKDQLADLKETNGITLKAEIAYWRDVKSQLKKGSDEYKEVVSTIRGLKKSLHEELLALNEEYKNESQAVYTQLANDIDALNAKYNEAVQSRANAITSSLGLFNEFKRSDVITKDTLTTNLQSQVEGLKEWSSTLDELSGKLSGTKLYDELKAMNSDSVDTLKELNAMSDEELQAYIKLYDEKEAIALDRAKKDNEALKQQTENEIEELKKTASEKLAELKAQYEKDLEALGLSAEEKSKKIGEQIVNGIAEGIASVDLSATQAVGNLVDELVTQAKTALGIASPSKVFANEVGKWIPEGIAVGIDKNAKSVLDSMRALTMSAVNGLGNSTMSAVSSGVVNNFTQNNYSPKALSRLEIYRQSKNLLGYAGGGY